MVRVFLLYNLFNSFLLCLVPKKLRVFFPPSWYINDKNPPPSEPQTESPARTDPVDLKRVFQMFDKNGDGRITKEELNDSLENLGIFIPDKDLIQMIEKMDANGDGCIDINEFESIYGSTVEEKEEEDMRDAFNVFDQDGDGFITVEELKCVMASLGLKQGINLKCCKEMIMHVDEDGDGKVNYKEFLQMMKTGGLAKHHDFSPSLSSIFSVNNFC